MCGSTRGRTTKDTWLLYKKPIHQCTPVRRSAFELLHQQGTYKAAIREGSQKRFTDNDPIIPFFLVYLIGLEEGMSCLHLFDDQVWVCIDEMETAREKLDLILKSQPKVFCINNDLGDQQQEEFKRAIGRFFEAYNLGVSLQRQTRSEFLERPSLRGTTA